MEGGSAVGAADRWAAALAVLCGPHASAVAPLIERVATLRAAGARLFEVVVGTPVEAYGARLTFGTGQGDPGAVAARAGVGGHPWGHPDWIGLRTTADGTVDAKAYHRRPPLDASLVHRGLPDTARPVMAALHRDSLEVYAVLPGQLTWQRFAAQALEPLGCAAQEPGVTVVPRADGFAVSVRQEEEVVTAVTLFATSAGLRSDADVDREWVATLTPAQAGEHRSRMAAAAALGGTSGRRYRMLAWSYTRAGLVSRAASVHSVG